MLVHALTDSVSYPLSTSRSHHQTPSLDSFCWSEDHFTETLMHEARHASHLSHKAAESLHHLALSEGMKKARREAAKSQRPRQQQPRAGKVKTRSHNGWMLAGL